MRALSIALTAFVLMSAHAVARDASTEPDWDDPEHYSEWIIDAYDEIRPLCREGPSSLSDISCKALRAYGEALIKSGHCFDKSEVEWVNCKPILTDVIPGKKPQ